MSGRGTVCHRPTGSSSLEGVGEPAGTPPLPALPLLLVLELELLLAVALPPPLCGELEGGSTAHQKLLGESLLLLLLLPVPPKEALAARARGLLAARARGLLAGALPLPLLP